MWWKTFVLLGLGSPLLLLAWQELHAHPDIVRPRESLPSADSLSRRRAEQQAFIKNLDDNDLDTGLASYLVSGSLDREPAAGNRPELNRQLAEAIKKHQTALDQVRAFRDDIILVQEDRKGDLASSGDFLTNVTKQRMELADLHKKLAEPKRMFERVSRSVNEKLMTRRPGRFAEVRPVLTSLQVDLKASGEQLGDFIPAAADFGVLRRDLEQKRKHLVMCGQLIELAEDADRLSRQESTTAVNVLDLMKRYAAMPEDLNALVRNQVNLFAEEYLTRDMVDDGMIRFYPLPRISSPFYDEVKKSTVTVVFNNGHEKPLLETMYTEVSPPSRDQFDYFRNEDSKFKDKAVKIAQTPRNQGVQYYNEARKRLRFTRQELQDFETRCPVKWGSDAPKPTEFKRIDHLLSAIEKYPSLFANNR